MIVFCHDTHEETRRHNKKQQKRRFDMAGLVRMFLFFFSKKMVYSQVIMSRSFSWGVLVDHL